MAKHEYLAEFIAQTYNFTEFKKISGEDKFKVLSISNKSKDKYLIKIIVRKIA